MVILIKILITLWRSVLPPWAAAHALSSSFCLNQFSWPRFICLEYHNCRRHLHHHLLLLLNIPIVIITNDRLHKIPTFSCCQMSSELVSVLLPFRSGESSTSCWPRAFENIFQTFPSLYPEKKHPCLQPLCQLVCDVADLRYRSHLDIIVYCMIVDHPAAWISRSSWEQAPPQTCRPPWQGWGCCWPSWESPWRELARPTPADSEGCARWLIRLKNPRNWNVKVSLFRNTLDQAGQIHLTICKKYTWPILRITHRPSAAAAVMVIPWLLSILTA